MAVPTLTVTPWQAAQAYAGVDRGAPAGAPSQSGQQFGATLARALGGVVDAGHDAEAKATQAVAGQGSVTDVVSALSKADLALQTTVAIRDRVILAYQDIMKMPI